MNDGLDAVIAKVLDWEPGAGEALIAAAPTGAKRAFDLYYGTASRGTTWYEAFLAEPRLTPLLRQEARWTLTYLRKGSPIPLQPW